MNDQQKWQLALTQATAIVALKRREAVGDPQAVSCGGQDSTTDTSFRRTGTSVIGKQMQLPSFLSSLIQNAAQGSDVPTNLTSAGNNFLQGLLTRNNSALGPNAQLDTALSQDPTQFVGKTSLTSQANVDPYSADYATQTQSRYQDAVGQGLAVARSGPDAVRGGTNRNTLREAEVVDKMALNRTDELRKSQLQDSTVQQSAAKILDSIEAGRKAFLLTGQNQAVTQLLSGNQQSLEAEKTVDAKRQGQTGTMAMAMKGLGTDLAQNSEKYQGTGTQASAGSNWNAGIDCCFIFLEALNGELPWYVRQGRDQFNTPTRRKGYVRMSKWLVPAMRRSKLVMHVVNQIIISPFLAMGKIHYGIEKGTLSYLRRLILKPYCFGWFHLWSFMGRKEVA